MAAFNDYKWEYNNTWDQWSTSASAHTMYIYPTYSGSTNPPAPPSPKIEMPEGPLDWLRRRVVEITDLAYAA